MPSNDMSSWPVDKLVKYITQLRRSVLARNRRIEEAYREGFEDGFDQGEREGLNATSADCIERVGTDDEGWAASQARKALEGEESP